MSSGRHTRLKNFKSGDKLGPRAYVDRSQGFQKHSYCKSKDSSKVEDEDQRSQSIFSVSISEKPDGFQ
jgi:hypothetical protein